MLPKCCRTSKEHFLFRKFFSKSLSNVSKYKKVTLVTGRLMLTWPMYLHHIQVSSDFKTPSPYFFHTFHQRVDGCLIGGKKILYKKFGGVTAILFILRIIKTKLRMLSKNAECTMISMAKRTTWWNWNIWRITSHL